jgi:motility/secretion related protein SprA/type IX secretion system substrate protein
MPSLPNFKQAFFCVIVFFFVFQQQLNSQEIDYPVYDAGFDMVPGGLMVMIDGRPLLEYCDWVGDYPRNKVKIINTRIACMDIKVKILDLSKPGIDDYFGPMQSRNLINNPFLWKLSGIPIGQPDLFPEASFAASQISGFNRAKLSWYKIDPLFYDQSGSDRPPNILDDELSKSEVRMVMQSEIFPMMNIENGQNTLQPIFNFAFYPNERGPYNFDVDSIAFSAGIGADGQLLKPETRWGAITQNLTVTNWDVLEMKYIDMLFMDPYSLGFDEDTLTDDPELLIQIGNFSDDINKDKLQFFEHAVNEEQSGQASPFGIVPLTKPIVMTFTDPKTQDQGLDGLGDEMERDYFGDFLSSISTKFGLESLAYKNTFADPSSDNYHCFLGSDYDTSSKYRSILERYKNYCNPQGNLFNYENNLVDYSVFYNKRPEFEDLNMNFDFDTIEQYFQYNVRLNRKDLFSDNPDIKRVTRYYSPIINGNYGMRDSVKWIRMRIPINEPDKIIGDLFILNDVQQIRLVVRGCGQELILRFAWLNASRVEDPFPTFDEDGYYEAFASLGDWAEAEIFPNPNNGHCILNVNSENTRRIEIINMHGEIVFAQEYDKPSRSNFQFGISQKLIHLPGLKAGLYIVRILNNDVRNTIQTAKMLVIE